MTVEACRFETERLLVSGWHPPDATEQQLRDLADIVAAMLNQDQDPTKPADSTPARESVMRWLPESWQGHYSTARARAWIDQRDREATTLLVVEKSTNHPAGLMILFEIESGDSAGAIEVRLGYILSGPFWRRGLASELIAGFVDWSRAQPGISRLAGGVSRLNPASQRVLEKNGFEPVPDQGGVSPDEQLFRLNLRVAQAKPTNF